MEETFILTKNLIIYNSSISSMKWSMIAYVCVFSLFVNQKSKCKGEDYWEKITAKVQLLLTVFENIFMWV